MGSLALEEEEKGAAMFMIESDLVVEPSPFAISDWQQDCGGLNLKDWGNGFNSPSILASGTTTNSTLNDHGLYIDPSSCDFGDVFFNSSNGNSCFQTTPISVLDYVQQSEAEDSMTYQQQQQQEQAQVSEFGNVGMFDQEGDTMEIQELLAGFTQQQPQLEAQDILHRLDRLAGELQDEIETSSPKIQHGGCGGGLLLPHQQCMSPTNSRMSSQGSSFNNPPVSSSPAYCVLPKSEEQLHQQHPIFINPKLELHQHQEEIIQNQEIVQNRHQIHHPKQEVLDNYHHHAQQQQQQQQQLSLIGHNVRSNQMRVSVGSIQNNNNSSAIGHLQQHQPVLPYPKFEPVDQQLRLVHMLLNCARAVGDENLDMARTILVQLRSLVVPHGSPMERLASYVTEALVARLSRNTRSDSFRGLVCDKLQQMSSTTRSDMLEAFWVFYEYIPIGKFTHLTMNQILLEAAERERMIHVVDFQVWYGAQWPAFLQSLAMRPEGPPMVRMTAVGSSMRDLQEAGSKLLDTARALRVPFEYCILHVEREEFHAGLIELRDGEAVLINSLCQFHCFLKRDPGGLDHFLQGLRTLRPRVVVMAENDADHNSPIFLHRFMACLQYYSAVFDAFDASLHMPGTLQGRKKLEELIAAQKLRNMIACEGSERVERHESMRSWNSRMEGVGFRAVSISHKAINQASLLLNLYFSNGYTLSNQDGFLILGWRGMPLNGVGAWI